MDSARLPELLRAEQPDANALVILLMNALQRSYYIGQNVAVFGVALRSLNERTTKLYQKYGFGLREETKNPLMVLPIWSLNELIEGQPRPTATKPPQ
jgi:hypothetical protein